MKGFSQKLQTPADLLDKLRSDLDRLKKCPSDLYAAFDFFVTAEHMPDWLGDKSIKSDNGLLAIVSHIANGAKHFKVSDKRHKTVTCMELRQDPWPDEEGVEREHLHINFNLQDGKFSGMELSALALANQVYAFWDSKLKGTID